jgi:transposase
MPLQEVAAYMKVLHERVAGIDVHKDMIKVAIRSPGAKPWTRKTEILTFGTFYGVLRAMARELRRRGVTHVVMEASGVCTEPVYYALCEQDFTEVLVINPAHAKALKGHKTDAKDCARLAELLECGLLQGSYIPPAELKEVRDLTRYRIKTVQARTSEIQRLGKALESAGIKLGSVASGITGQGPTAMIEALIDGERRGPVMADLARGRARTAAKMADLSMALEGRFTDHHALMCRLHRDRIEILDTAVADLDTRARDKAAPWQREIDLLKTIPGFGDVVAWAWIAEIGPAPHQWFATSGKLASWVSLAPGNYISAGKRKHSRTGDAGTYIKPVLVQAAWAAVKGRGGSRTVTTAWSAASAGRRTRGEKEGHRRDRAHPAQDRLLSPQDRNPLPGPGSRFLHPARITRPAPGLAGAPAPRAPPRLHRHRHHRPAPRSRPGGRLTPAVTRQQFPGSQPPGAAAKPGTPAPITPDKSRTHQPSPPHGPGFATACPAGPSFRVKQEAWMWQLTTRRRPGRCRTRGEYQGPAVTPATGTPTVDAALTARLRRSFPAGPPGAPVTAGPPVTI